MAGDPVRPRLDDPRLPARARRPELPRRPRRSSTWRSWPGWASRGRCTSAGTPSSARRCSSSATRRSRRWPRPPSGATPCGASACPSPTPGPTSPTSRPAPSTTATASSSTARRSGPATPWSPTKCFCYVRTDPDVPKHKGISVLIIDVDTPGLRGAPAAPHLGPGRVRRGVPHRRRRAQGEPRRRDQRRLADHDGLAGPRARRAVGGGRDGRAPVASTTSSALAQASGLDGDPVVRRRIAELSMRVRSLAGPRLQGLRHRSRRARRRPSTAT